MTSRWWVIVVVGCLAAAAANGAPKNEPTGDNLAVNPGFERPEQDGERPEGWDYFSSKELNFSVKSDLNRSGSRALYLAMQGEKDAHLGLFQSMPVQPNKQYMFQAYAINNPEDPLQGHGRGNLGIEWRDADGREIERVESEWWNRDLPQLSWTVFEIRARAPRKAVSAAFVIYLYDGTEADGDTGSCFVDDVVIMGP